MKRQVVSTNAQGQLVWTYVDEGPSACESGHGRPMQPLSHRGTYAQYRIGAASGGQDS